MEKIVVFTDGASRGNPGKGGWAAIIVESRKSKGESKVLELGGREEGATNNKMELMAALETFRLIENRSLLGDIEVHTDSAYLANGATGWVYSWEKNGWKTKEGEPVSNQEIWKELAMIQFRLKLHRKVAWQRVAGHAGLRGNERVDELATRFADGEAVPLFVGSLTDYEKIIGGDLFDEESGERDAKMRSKLPAYSYISKIGTMIELHKTWPECEARVKGRAGAKYRKTISKEDEEALVELWSKE